MNYDLVALCVAVLVVIGLSAASIASTVEVYRRRRW